MAFELPALPYAQDALEPHVSARTMSFHYGKHHQGYVNKLNKAVEGTDLASKSLEELIKESFGDSAKTGVFNNAAQVWNHTFFWHSMSPNGGGTPSGEVAEKINAAFGDVEKFKEEFKQAALAQFGSGWAWLVLEDGKMKISKTPNAENPLVHNQTPLFTVDVWEHAYYLDYQNERGTFVGRVLDNLINWDFIEKNMKA